MEKDCQASSQNQLFMAETKAGNTWKPSSHEEIKSTQGNKTHQFPNNWFALFSYFRLHFHPMAKGLFCLLNILGTLEENSSFSSCRKLLISLTFCCILFYLRLNQTRCLCNFLYDHFRRYVCVKIFILSSFPSISLSMLLIPRKAFLQ